MKETIQQLEAERMRWAAETFKEATALSSLIKLNGEISEVKEAIELNKPIGEITEEYADCLMCLFDSAGRIAISPDDIFEAFAKKLKKNKARSWNRNADNTYSHIKHGGIINNG